MNVITSKENETIKQVRKLKEKKYRDESHVFLVDGMKRFSFVRTVLKMEVSTRNLSIKLPNKTVFM